MVADQDETLLLALLNSTPVVRAQQVDELADEVVAAANLRGWGGTGTPAELTAVRAARDDLQAVVRAERPPVELRAHLADLTQVPAVDGGRLTWQLAAAPDRLLAVRAVLTFFALVERAPGRLRPCENQACRLFLLDRSRDSRARWCSMAVCGNRMKARRHATRTRREDSEPVSA